MDFGKIMFFGLCSMGVQIDYIDKEKRIVYISIPKESVDYDQSSTIKTAQDFARSIKEKVFESKFNVKYKVRDEAWTEEKKEQALNDIKKNYYEDMF